ncbi:MAG: hypothetical protein ABJD11_09440 [Gemmatimonadota bacterium]
MIVHRLIRFVAPITFAIAVNGCADTTAPLPPAEEVVLIVNSTEATLSIIPVDAPSSAVKVPLGGTSPTPVGVSARGEVALVPLGLDNSVAVVNLKTATVSRTIQLPANSGATGSAFVNDTFAYVGNPNLNTVTRINYLTGDTATVAVGVFPQGLSYTRGRLFVVNGNLVNFAPAGASWITVIDPVTNLKSTGIDSIALTGSGNASFADVGSDGLLYVMNTGDYTSGQGRLSIVDPVARTELASFAGFGTGPGNVAADATSDHLFVSSYTEGVMEFDMPTRTVLKGAGAGIAIPLNAAVVVDSKGRVYALDTGPCAGGVAGTLHVLRPDLTQSSTIPTGECPVGGAVTLVP